MQITLTKNNVKFDVVINEDLSATINGNKAHFDTKYNAVILTNGGNLLDTEGNEIIDLQGLSVNGLRLDNIHTEKIIKIHEKFKKEYNKIYKEQREYVPQVVKYINGKFVYTSTFKINVAVSEVIEKLNLLVYECDKELHDKITSLVDESGYIQTSDLLDLKEYKQYVKDLKKYEKINKSNEKLKEQFEKLIIDKQGVGLDECQSCNQLIIVGDVYRKFLPKVIFFSARNQLLNAQEKSNKYRNFCEAITDDFYFVKIGQIDICNFCHTE